MMIKTDKVSALLMKMKEETENQTSNYKHDDMCDFKKSGFTKPLLLFKILHTFPGS